MVDFTQLAHRLRREREPQPLVVTLVKQGLGHQVGVPSRVIE